MSALPRELIVCVDGPLDALSLDDVAVRALHPALPGYARVFADDARLDALCEALRALPNVRAAYIKPETSPAWEPTAVTPRDDAPANTPDFTARQSYLDAAPAGVDARASWAHPGGDGAGVGVIDIEGAWRFTHEDLKENKGGVVGGEPARSRDWRNHGTAVIGIIGGDRNDLGVTGIAPAATVSAVSVFGGTGSAGAIVLAAQKCAPGDVILVELHRPGPRARRGGQQGFIAIEWWPDDYDAVRYATDRGVLVVEAAGNGAEDLDHPAYDTPARGFPAGWKNPFRRGDRDSGAILVGAGAPPPGTHGRDHGPDRSRLDFSNHGSAVDAQGWGREVTTCGYGDLQGGGDEDRWYSDTFSGTSSASPVVVGTLACVQGILKARQQSPLTPRAARELLREGGSAQTDAPDRPARQRIGPRPDLRELIPRLPAPAPTPNALSDAAWRVAAEQMVSLARGPLVHAVMKTVAAQGVVTHTRLEEMLRGEAGDALLRVTLALGLDALGARVPVASRLARELRVSAMTRVAGVLAGPLQQVLRESGLLGFPRR